MKVAKKLLDKYLSCVWFFSLIKPHYNFWHDLNPHHKLWCFNFLWFFWIFFGKIPNTCWASHKISLIIFIFVFPRIYCFKIFIESHYNNPHVKSSFSMFSSSYLPSHMADDVVCIVNMNTKYTSRENNNCFMLLTFHVRCNHGLCRMGGLWNKS